MTIFQSAVLSLLAANAAASTTETITQSDCEETYKSLDFGSQYFSRYNEYFHESSTLRLYSAGGNWRGPALIEDFMHYIYDSPFFFSVLMDEEIGLKTIDQDVCVFERFCLMGRQWNSGLTKDYPDSKCASYEQIFFNMTSNKIDHIEMYESKPYTKWLWGDVLATDKMKAYVCSRIVNRCGGEPAADVTNMAECMVKIEDLPFTTNEIYYDGNSVGCRAFHGIFTAYNPEEHCPHVMFEPTPDPKGGIMCQESFNNNPDEVFNEEDYAAFDAFQEKNGIDPMVGYTFVDNTDAQSPMATSGLRLVTKS